MAEVITNHSGTRAIYFRTDLKQILDYFRSVEYDKVTPEHAKVRDRACEADQFVHLKLRVREV
jgi:hypothetical protein